MLERLFNLREHHTTPATEIMAGVATFLTAVYILTVNPLIQSQAGMPADALFTATALAILAGTLLMAFWANMPLLLAPGMGINAYFAFSIVLEKKYTWPEALTAILLAGLLFVAAGFAGIRQALLRAFPEVLRHAMTVSLGLMIAVIGLKNANVVVFQGNLITLNTIGIGSPPFLALVGLVLTGLFLVLRFRAAVLFGIIATTVVGVFTGVTDYQAVATTGAFSLPPSVAPIAMAFSWDMNRIATMDFAAMVFTLFALDIFDSLGTFVGVFTHFGEAERGRYERAIPKALMCDAVATVAGACVGTSTVTTFVESSTGIAAGGKTGLVALTIAVLVFLSLFLSPLFLMVPAAATTPALVVVGMYMLGQARRIAFEDVADGLPAIIMIVITTLTCSISDGLMFGWIAYVVFRLLSGRWRELTVTSVLVGLFFLVRLIGLENLERLIRSV
ncbi:MAG: NCS2 family permease [Planctomycetes bacterium]|nr:NCS2 family permease [Planctomycetota bacterium]